MLFWIKKKILVHTPATTQGLNWFMFCFVLIAVFLSFFRWQSFPWSPCCVRCWSCLYILAAVKRCWPLCLCSLFRMCSTDLRYKAHSSVNYACNAIKAVLQPPRISHFVFSPLLTLWLLNVSYTQPPETNTAIFCVASSQSPPFLPCLANGPLTRR